MSIITQSNFFFKYPFLIVVVLTPKGMTSRASLTQKVTLKNYHFYIIYIMEYKSSPSSIMREWMATYIFPLVGDFNCVSETSTVLLITSYLNVF